MPSLKYGEKYIVDISLILKKYGNTPQQNAYVERYNRTVRYDWLNQHMFMSIGEAQDSATQ